MNKVNHCYILRYFQVQVASELAESGNDRQMQPLQALIKNLISNK